MITYFPAWRNKPAVVTYGDWEDWPSWSYWIVPGTIPEDV